MTMIEVEVKFRVDSLNVVRDRLRSLNAKFIDMLHEEDIYFEHPCRSFLASDEALRVRVSRSNARKDVTVTLSYKGPRGTYGAKSREEIEVEIRPDDLNKLLSMVERLGFKRRATLSKIREVYSYDHYTINLDEVKDVGIFVEIEAVVSDPSLVKSVADEVMRFSTSSLGLSPDAIERRTYLELMIMRESGTAKP